MSIEHSRHQRRGLSGGIISGASLGLIIATAVFALVSLLPGCHAVDLIKLGPGRTTDRRTSLRQARTTAPWTILGPLYRSTHLGPARDAGT
jgi:hypothetical protein